MHSNSNHRNNNNRDKKPRTPYVYNPKRTYYAVRKISDKFKSLTRGMPNGRGSVLHGWQTDLAYIINDATNGFNYTAQKHVARAEQFVNEIEAKLLESKSK